jgi:ketosteroid isomerase-like protein
MHLRSPARFVLVLSALLLSVTALPAQQIDLAREEAAIRAAIHGEREPMIEVPIIWTGAYPEPIVGRVFQNGQPASSYASLRSNQRRDERTGFDVVRIGVSRAGDLAYDFSNHTLTFTQADTGERVTSRGSILRVWTKEDGQWKVAALFQMPHNRAPSVRLADAEAMVRAARAEYFPAYFRGDAIALERLEADDFVVIGPTGRIGTTEDRYARIRRAVENGTWSVDGAGLEEENLSFRISGNAVVVHGTALAGPSGARQKIAFTEIWSQEGGTWQLRHIQYIPVQ